MMSMHTIPNGAPLTGAPACPKCGGRMWDNRQSKRSARAPDFKCRNPQCDGRIWPGQHHAAAPIIALHAASLGNRRAPADESSTVDSREQVSGILNETPTAVALRQCYLGVTDFVLAEVRSRYEAAHVPCSDATAAAIVATLFIAICKERGV